MEYPDKKERSFKRFLKSFKFAYQGLKYAFTYEQNMVVHILVTIVVIILGVLLKISVIEWLFCFRHLPKPAPSHHSYWYNRLRHSY